MLLFLLYFLSKNMQQAFFKNITFFWPRSFERKSMIMYFLPDKYGQMFVT